MNKITPIYSQITVLINQIHLFKVEGINSRPVLIISKNSRLIIASTAEATPTTGSEVVRIKHFVLPLQLHNHFKEHVGRGILN